MFMNTLVHELFVYVCLFRKINEQQTLVIMLIVISPISGIWWCVV